MRISEDRVVAVRKLMPLNERLARQFGVEIDMGSDIAHLNFILEHYSNKRRDLLSGMGETAAMLEPDYTKAVLISETVRLLLREIAPKRKRRKK
jgi:hypothetical protein